MKVGDFSVRLPGDQSLAYLDNPLVRLSLLDQRPAPQDDPQRQEEWKSLLARQGNRGFCSLLDGPPLPTDRADPPA